MNVALAREQTEATETVNDEVVIELVRALDRGSLSELMALMSLGRRANGEDAGMWDDLVRKASVQSNSSQGDFSYVTDKTPLGEYLRNGLRRVEE